jgi:hypothetical protein
MFVLSKRELATDSCQTHHSRWHLAESRLSQLAVASVPPMPPKPYPKPQPLPPNPQPNPLPQPNPMPTPGPPPMPGPRRRFAGSRGTHLILGEHRRYRHVECWIYQLGQELFFGAVSH